MPTPEAVQSFGQLTGETGSFLVGTHPEDSTPGHEPKPQAQMAIGFPHCHLTRSHPTCPTGAPCGHTV